MKPNRLRGLPAATFLAVGAFALVWLLLWLFSVPLGKPGTFTYPWSPIPGLRARALPAGLLVGGVLALGVAWSWSTAVGRRRAGVALGLVGGAAACFWGFTAPPRWTAQHAFNLLSPSQDGAFLIEAGQVSDAAVYLRGFPQRAATPREQMRGTRVISNPPATTLFCAGLEAGLDRFPSVAAWFDRRFVDPDVQPASERRRLVQPLATAAAFQALWAAAGPVLYLAARQALPAGPALLATLLAWFAPPALLLAPGKDPAQLLTVALPLWLWLLAVRRGSRLAAVGAGGLAAAACLVSLVHVWIGAIVVLASALSGCRGRVLWLMFLAAGGGLAAMGLIWLATGANVPAILLAAARAQSEVTRGPNAMPLAWQALGVPLFLLFCGPATMALLAASVRRGGVEPCNAVPRTTDRGKAEPRTTKPGMAKSPTDCEWRAFGGWMLVLSVVVLVATVGFTNIETPRLWLPFLPLLVMGALLRMGAGETDGLGRLPVSIAVGLIAAQWLCGLLQWWLMDMRETELRLLRDATGAARMFH